MDKNKITPTGEKDLFASLDNVISITQSDLGRNQKQGEVDTNWKPIIPAPCEPVKPITARVHFDRKDGKAVLPFTYGVHQVKTGWHHKAHKGSATLYHLDQIIKHQEKIVLLIEG